MDLNTPLFAWFTIIILTCTYCIVPFLLILFNSVVNFLCKFWQLPEQVVCMEMHRRTCWTRWPTLHRLPTSTYGVWRQKTSPKRDWTSSMTSRLHLSTITDWHSSPAWKPKTIRFGASNSIRRRTCTSGARCLYPILLAMLMPDNISPSFSSTKVRISSFYH